MQQLKATPPKDGTESPPTFTGGESWTATSHSKQNPDGSVTTDLYSGPAFRHTAAGWSKIDPTVKPATDGQHAASAEGVTRPIRFGQSASDIVDLALDGGPVTLSASSLNIGKPEVASDGVRYLNVATDTDLEYQVTGDGVKESLLLKSSQAPTSFTFRLADPSGQLHGGKGQSDGSFRFGARFDSSLALDLLPAFAYSAADHGAAHGRDPKSAHLSATSAGNGYDVTVSVDPTWAQGKAFPLVLDPTMAFNEANNAVADGSDYNTTNGPGTNTVNTADQGLPAGTYTDQTHDYEPARSFFKFDLSQIPTRASITNAHLGLYLGGCLGYNSGYSFHDPSGNYYCNQHTYTVEFHQLSSSWDSTTTWNQLNSATSPTAFASIAESSFGANVGGANPQARSVDMTSTVQSVFSPTNTAFNFAMKLSSEPTNIGGPLYDSSVNSWIFHPALTVTYTPPLYAPQQMLASDYNETAVFAHWAPPSTAPSTPAITGYEVYLFQVAQPSNLLVSDATVCATCLAASVTGLTGGQSYYFGIRTLSASGDSLIVGSNTVVTGGGPATAPSVLDGAGVTNTTGYFVRGESLAWTTSVVNYNAATVAVGTVTDTFPATVAVAPATQVQVIVNHAAQGVTCGSLGLTCNLANNALTVTGLGTVPSGKQYDFKFNVVAVGLGRGCSSAWDTLSAPNATATSQSLIAFTVCDGALGVENWWSFLKRPIGAQGQALVNPADGNLVVQQTDSAPIQAHGRLSYVLRRTYNSQDSGVLALPGGIGAGWQFNVSQTDDLAGGGVAPTSLYVPSDQTVLNPLAVTLIDRDGTRHVFQPRGLNASAALDVVSLPTALSTLAPKVLGLNLGSGFHLCVEQTYSAPAGVHLGLWRYVRVGTSTPCTSADTATGAAVIGFAAVRPDRLRSEFSWNGRLLDIADASGVELRYLYTATPLTGPVPLAPTDVGNLSRVYEPQSCVDPSVATCRAFRFSYPSSTEVDVSDPAARTTIYRLDTNAPARLTEVDNPDGSRLTYTYGTCGGSAVQLCSATDPRGNQAAVTYAAALAGPPAVATLSDRLGKAASPTSPVSFTYQNPSYVTADEGTHRTRFENIDGAGRVSVLNEGDTSDNYLHQDFYTWDAPGATCRQPDAVVDNNLCGLLRKSLSTFSADENTTSVYNAEGNLLRTRQLNGATTLDTTYGYTDEYFEATSSSPVVYSDGVQGSGNVTSTNGGSGSRTDSATLFALSDRTQALSPRGNAQGGAYLPYLSSYVVDNATSASPNVFSLAATRCGGGAPTANTGSLCESDIAESGTTTPPAGRCSPNPARSSAYACTRNTYDGFGQKLTTISPKAAVETPTGQTPPATTYTYYGDATLDLSNNVSAGGWLKGVTDPTGHFVAFAYDRAGNAVRTWDRNATNGQALTAYPGTVSSPPSTAFRETLYGPHANAPSGATGYSAPWRYVLSDRDPLGDLTTYTLDANGNRTRTRPPRGNAAGNLTYDTTQTFDAGDDLLTNLTPLEFGANKTTTYVYDVFGNRTQQTDPDGNIQTWLYDATNRQFLHEWARGPATSPLPAGCHNSTSASSDPPYPATTELCFESVGFDGEDNVVGRQDGNGQDTFFTYDPAGRKTLVSVPRFDGTIASLISESAYDADGHPTDVCAPRQFSEGGYTAGPPPTLCASTARFGQHLAYDIAGRQTTKTTYRDNSGPGQTTSFGYDADGNPTSMTDANNHLTTTAYDLLDRKATQAVPRDASTTETTAWTYDSVGNVTALTRPGSLITAYSYDADNRSVDSVAGADNPSAAAAGLVDANGTKNIRTRVAYDADGNVVAQFDPRAFTASTTTPNAEFMVRTDFDADGHPATHYVPRYDTGAASDLGLSSTQTSQCSATPNPAPASIPGVPAYPVGVGLCLTRVFYDPAGNRSQLRLPTSNGSDNRYVNFAYTPDNLLASVDAPSPAGGRVTATSYVYDGDAKPVTVTSAAGTSVARQETMTYNSDETLATDAYSSGVQANGTTATHTTSYVYDAAGNLTKTTDPVGNVTQATFWNDNLRKDQTDGAGDETSYVYDPVGNATAVTSPSANAQDSTNPSGTPTTNTYTFDNLLLTATVPVAGDGSTRRQTTYAYDPAGRKLSQAVATVNASGGVIAAGGTQSFSYFPDDRLGTQTGRNSGSITDAYDPAGNHTSVQDSTGGGSTITSTYYLDGLARTVDDGARKTEYSYDGAASPVARAEVVDAPPNTTYSTTYGYNDAELASSMASAAAGGTTSWTYDAAGRPQSEGDPNGDSVAFTYNADDTLRSQALTHSSTNLATWTYNYDNDFRQTDQTLTGTSASGGTYVSGTFGYTYDAASRVHTDTDNTGAVRNLTWDHDSNRTSFAQSTSQPDNVSATYKADDSINTQTVGTTTSPTYQYAPFGGLINDGCYTYGFDGFDRTTSATETPPVPSSCPIGNNQTPLSALYSYDGLDRQRSHTDATSGLSTVHYDGLAPTVAIETPTSGVDDVYELTPHGKPRAVTVTTPLSPSTQYLTDDGQGNISTATTSSAAVQCTARFDSFGNAVKAQGQSNPCNTGSANGDVFYRGSRRDATTGDYQFGSRQYDPSKDSFLTPDSYRSGPSDQNLSVGVDPLTRNSYSYVNGDPLNLIDPTGHGQCDASDSCNEPPAASPSPFAGALGELHREDTMPGGNDQMIAEKQAKMRTELDKNHVRPKGYDQAGYLAQKDYYAQFEQWKQHRCDSAIVPWICQHKKVLTYTFGGIAIGAAAVATGGAAVAVVEGGGAATAATGVATAATTGAAAEPEVANAIQSVADEAEPAVAAASGEAGAVGETVTAAAEGDEALLGQARVARDALADEVGSRAATVTGGYNVETGEVAAACSGAGFCAEDAVVSKLGGNAADVRFTEAIRPRTGLEVPVCEFCQAKYAPSQFPPGVQYKPGFPWDLGFWYEP
jgi:RHS repeat-associated protein